MTRLRAAHPFLWIVLPPLSTAVSRVDSLRDLRADSLAGLLILWSIAAVLCAALRVLLPTWRMAAVAATGLLLLTFAYGLHTLVILRWPLMARLLPQSIAIPIWLACVAFAVHRAWVKRATFDIARIERGLWVAGAGCLAAILLPRAVLSQNPALTLPEPGAGVVAQRIPAQPPDIYYVIVDSYPALETLAADYQFEDPAFNEFLRSRRFQVLPRARSNYAFTQLSLSSSLNLNLLSAFGATPQEQVSHTRTLVEQNLLMRTLKARGYAPYHIGPMQVSPDLATVDNTRLFNAGLTDLLTATPAAGFAPYAWERWDARFRLPRQLDDLARVARAPGPKFVYAHLICPHPPFVFGPGGEDVPALRSRLEARESMKGQVAFLNRALTPVLDGILRDAPREPIIVLQGDHGIAYAFSRELNVPGLASPEFKLAQMSILNAIHVPADLPVTFYGTMTPANTFRVIFNALFGDAWPLVPDRSYFSTHFRPADFEDIGDPEP